MEFKCESVLSRIINIIITAIFFIIVILVILLVILRYIFNTGITGGNELMEYLFVYTTALGAAVAIGKNEHIRIGVFTDNQSPIVKKIVDIFGILCIAIINVVFIYLSQRWISKVGGSESPVLRVPMRFIMMSVPIGCGLSVVYCVFNILKLFRKSEEER